MQQDYTISAIATPLGEGGIGIIRLSGEKAIEIATKIFKPHNQQKTLGDYPLRTAVFGNIVDEADNILDEVICLIMAAPHSYTCEDVVELQCHGGSLIMEEILSLTYRCGARPAEPGEFTKRAFLNGRLDLSQAQAVMEVIQSKTKAALEMANSHLQGKFSSRIKELRFQILDLIAHLEASIDFPEDDIEDLALDEANRKVSSLCNEVEEMIASVHTGIILREGLKTAIIGRPNAGKSSLMNLLLGQERAIVTNIPGTTRDSIEEYVNFAGIPLCLADTAGIRQTQDIVEKIGVEKAYNYAQDSEMVLAVFDGSAPLTHEDQEIFQLLQKCQGEVIVIINKSDLEMSLSEEAIKVALEEHQLHNIQHVLNMSAQGGLGLAELEEAVKKLVYGGNVQSHEANFVSDARQAEVLRQAAALLNETRLTLSTGLSEDFVVIDLRAAWEKLGEITGDTIDDDIIDQIFKNFCIGK